MRATAITEVYQIGKLGDVSDTNTEPPIWTHFSIFDFVVMPLMHYKRTSTHLLEPNRTYSTLTATTLTVSSPFQFFSPTDIGTLKIAETANAGGDSVASEAIAFDVLSRMFDASLEADEMAVRYGCNGGPMIDFLARVGQTPASVSVTRCFYGAPEVVAANSASTGRNAAANRGNVLSRAPK
jgi:hypothetical protein